MVCDVHVYAAMLCRHWSQCFLQRVRLVLTKSGSPRSARARVRCVPWCTTALQEIADRRLKRSCLQSLSWGTIRPGARSCLASKVMSMKACRCSSVRHLLLLATRAWLLVARYDHGYWVKTSAGLRNTSRRQVPDAEASRLVIKFA